MQRSGRFAFRIFLAYLAVFPGSTLTVALDRVPVWGVWMGSALLIVQGLAVLIWLIEFGGRRGALLGLLVFLLAWGVEHLGVATGLPFGHYSYTAALQPQLPGGVPLAIPCAWLVVVVGAWQIAAAGQGPKTEDQKTSGTLVYRPWSLVGTATLVVLLDLQIEPVATLVNRYWVWHDTGPYYGIPTSNFIGWWVVGLGIALLVDRMLGETRSAEREAQSAERRIENQEQVGAKENQKLRIQNSAFKTPHLVRSIPACLYLLSTLMFAVVNLARGFPAAGLIGVGVLVGFCTLVLRPGRAVRPPLLQGLSIRKTQRYEDTQG